MKRVTCIVTGLAPLAVADYELKPAADPERLFETIAGLVRRVKGR